MPPEDKDEPLYKHPESAEELVSAMDDEQLRLKKVAFLRANGAIGLRMNSALQMVANRAKDATKAESLGGGRFTDRVRRRTHGHLADARAKLEREIERTIDASGLRERWEEFDSSSGADWDEINEPLDFDSGQAELEGQSGSPATEPAPEAPEADTEAGPEQEDEGAEESRGVVVSLLAPNVAGDYAVFVALPERLLIVEEQEGDSDLGVLADAVESRLEAPYRARALRVDEGRFVVVASEIETVELPGLDGEELVVFALPDGQRTAVLDAGSHQLVTAEVEAILEESAPCLLRLENIDESVWEVSVDLL